jgi:hypothetical protein
MTQIQPDDILRGPFWPEKIRVISVKPLGERGIKNVTSNPELYVIQNPAAHLKPEEEINIMRYIVENWKDKAEYVK